MFETENLNRPPDESVLLKFTILNSTKTYVVGTH